MKWALIDVSWLAHRAKHAVGGLAFGGGVTGVIYGFLEELRAVAADRLVATNHVALCLDDRASLRRDALPGYKRRHKVKTAEEEVDALEFADQMRRLRYEILPAAGFVLLGQSGLESDDVMAQAALQMDGIPGWPHVMVTADNDLYQCITDRVHWYDPSRNLYLDPAGAHYKLGIPPSEWGHVKCISGCAGDCVPGVPGVGPKTATDYLLRLLKRGKRYDAIVSEDGQRTVRFNRRLVLLPHRETRPVDLRPPAYKPEAFYRAAEKLGFASYLDGSRRRAWDAFFAGDFTGSRQRPRMREARV